MGDPAMFQWNLEIADEENSSSKAKSKNISHILWLGSDLCSMLIKVKTLTGKEIEIDIEPTDKVERIKERVEEKEGIPPPQQRLIFSVW